MKKQHIFFITCFLASTLWCSAQILTISEKRNGQAEIVNPNGPQIVDINGQLEIGISKDSLIKKIRIAHPEFGDQLDFQERIDALEKALTNQETILKRLKQQTLDKTNKKAFYDELDGFYKNLMRDGNEDLRAEANALFGEWREQFGPRSSNPNSGIRKEVYILTNFNNNLKLAKQNLASFKGQSFTVSMIAHVHSDLGKNRVHIENFDTIAESEIYTVPRWVTSLSADQQTELQELQKRTNEYNIEAPKYFASFKAELLSKMPDISCIGDLKNDIQNFINNSNLTSEIKNALRADVQAIISEYNGIETIIGLVSQDIGSWTISTPFEIITHVQKLIGTIENTGNAFDKFKTTAEAFDRIMTQVTTLTGSFKTCYDTLKDEINGLTQAMSILKNQQDRFQDNDEIGEEVSKFTLNDLPALGFIKLKRSGQRDNGDELEIVLVLRMPGNQPSTNPNIPAQERNESLESHVLTMQLVGLRSETAVGIIMANSFNENGFTAVEDKQFLYAPSAALLLKVGSRKSKLYNDFLDFGLGIAISTPDFNTDGTPEFGAGLMFTAFKNILSVGINYNVTLDTPYWSWGINLPFNLPGIPINKPE